MLSLRAVQNRNIVVQNKEKKKGIFNPFPTPFFLKVALPSSQVPMPKATDTLFVCTDSLQQLSGEEVPSENCQFLSMQIGFKPVFPRLLQ